MKGTKQKDGMREGETEEMMDETKENFDGAAIKSRLDLRQGCIK